MKEIYSPKNIYCINFNPLRLPVEFITKYFNLPQIIEYDTLRNKYNYTFSLNSYRNPYYNNFKNLLKSVKFPKYIKFVIDRCDGLYISINQAYPTIRKKILNVYINIYNFEAETEIGVLRLENMYNVYSKMEPTLKIIEYSENQDNYTCYYNQMTILDRRDGRVV